MNLEKAIETLTDQYKRHKVGGDLNYRDALQLGIEALERCLLARKEFGYIDPSLLQGETKE